MSYHILIVDDDSLFREEFRECLELEYRVIEASSGEAAIEILKKPNEIDLAILDVIMPGCRGTEIIKDLRKLSPELIVIISTGFGTKDVVLEALQGRADDYIEKPLNIEKTMALIKTYIQKKAGLMTTGEGTRTKIRHIQRFLERNYDKKVRLKDAAESVCLSPKYLSRAFEEHAGVGFSEYKLKVKVDKAKSLLKETDINIDQISDELGYENTESFIKIFRKFIGQTPAAYRKKYEPRRVPVLERPASSNGEAEGRPSKAPRTGRNLAQKNAVQRMTS